MIRKIKKYIDFLKPKKKKTLFDKVMDELDSRSFGNFRLHFFYIGDASKSFPKYRTLDISVKSFIEERKYCNEDSFIEALRSGNFSMSPPDSGGFRGGPFNGVGFSDVTDDNRWTGDYFLIKELIKKWILKNQFRNFEKILSLLEENNIYLSDIVYETWKLPVHDQYFGILVKIDRINSNFLKDLTKLVWDPSI